jgi:GNAT superfamily N-acetyltransferase
VTSRFGDIEDDLKALERRWQEAGVDLDVSLSREDIHLGRIVVPKGARGRGLGTRVMEDLTALADHYGLRITLSPATDFGGTSVDRLKRFYRRFGFVSNKGRHKDFRIGATMYRSPGAPRRELEEADDQPNPWYHLTDRARFRLDPRFAPEDNAIAIVDRSGRPGIYLGQDVERWVNGYNYWRPFVVEFDVDPSVVEDPGVHGRYGGEMFVPATSFDKLTILRVIPLDAHAREVFGEAGWIEGELGIEFDTGDPIRPGHRSYRGYRYSGPDVRDMPPSQVNHLKRQLRQVKRQ